MQYIFDQTNIPPQQPALCLAYFPFHRALWLIWAAEMTGYLFMARLYPTASMDHILRVHHPLMTPRQIRLGCCDISVSWDAGVNLREAQLDRIVALFLVRFPRGSYYSAFPPAVKPPLSSTNPL